MKHICGLECEHYCCYIEGHEYNEGVCEHCNHERDEDQYYKDLETESRISRWKDEK